MHALVWLLAGLAFVIGVPCLCMAMARSGGGPASGPAARPVMPTAVPAPPDEPDPWIDPETVPEEDVPRDDPERETPGDRRMTAPTVDWECLAALPAPSLFPLETR